MPENPLFIDNLIAAVVDSPLREKLLLAPSHRVGRQWLDRAASAAGAVVNVRVTSLRRLMLDFAQPVLDRKKSRPATKEELMRIVGEAVAGLGADNRGGGYFARLPSGITLTESMLRSLEELENAGIKGGAVFSGKLVASEKADEMAALLNRYRTVKRKSRLVGFGEIGQAALDGIAGRNSDVLPHLLLPISALEDAIGFERRFLGLWPREKIRILDEELSDSPGGELSFFTADCIANETRQVLRHVAGQGIPLDRVEVICLDSKGYVPAFCSAGLEVFGGSVEDLPFTFGGGIPASFSRPARLLRAWLDWLTDDLPAAVLADAIEAGLLGEGWQSRAPGITASSLAARLKSLPIQAGPEDYRKALGRGDSREDVRLAEEWLGETVRTILPLDDNGTALALSSPEKVLDAADSLLRLASANDGKLDAYARLAAHEAVAAWRDCGGWPGFDAVRWLETFVAGLRVMGLGPQPARMHIADGVAGGHSGRPVTFILGMDEGRCAATVRQDPILLDRERKDLSRHLRGSGWRRERRENALRRLFGRLRGNVVLSHARYDFDSGRELYPSVLFAGLTGQKAGAPKTLRPAGTSFRLNRRDDWLWSLLAWRKNRLTVRDLRPWFPHLTQGGVAAAARESAVFGEWDGYVPEAGADFMADEWVLSPSQLELLAASPLDFFFRKVLGVRKPDRWEPEAGRWLAGNERGQLLHDLFQDFMTELLRRDETPTLEHGDLMQTLLKRSVELWRRRVPVNDEFAFAREQQELYDAAAIFLFHEIDRAQRGRPVCFEASIGGAAADSPPWHRVEPVLLEFGANAAVRLQGRVDRVDRLHDNGGLVIWDYKTGRSSGFSQTNAMAGGRHLQPYLYTAMLERLLDECGLADRVKEFCYFFPMLRDEGETIRYSREELRDGRDIVRALIGLLRAGCFPFARKEEDIRFSDYLDVYGDVRGLASASRRKTEENDRLADWRELQRLETRKPE